MIVLVLLNCVFLSNNSSAQAQADDKVAGFLNAKTNPAILITRDRKDADKSGILAIDPESPGLETFHGFKTYGIARGTIRPCSIAKACLLLKSFTPIRYVPTTAQQVVGLGPNN
jgi:hypothetical protein